MEVKYFMTEVNQYLNLISPIILGLLLSAFFIHSSTAIHYLPFKLTSYDSLRWIQLLVLSLSSFLAFSTLTHIRIRKSSTIIFSLTILIMISSLVITPSTIGAAEIFLISLLFISGSIISQKLSEKQDNQYIEIVAISFLFVSILYIVQTLSALLPHCIHDLKCDTVEGNYLGFGNKRQFSHIQVGLLPFSVWLSINCQNIWLRRCAAVTSTFLIWLLISLDARGAFIAIVLSGGLVGIWYRWSLNRWLHILKLASAALIFWALTKAPSFLHDPSAAGLSVRTNSAGRVDLWQKTFSGSFNNVWLGNGPGSFAAAGGSFSTPHNIILQVAYDYGYVVALSCILWMLLTATTSLKQPEKNIWVLPWAIIGWLLYSLVSNPQTTPLGQTMFLVTTALIFSSTHKDSCYTYPLNKKIKIIFGISISAIYLLISYIYTKISLYDIVRHAPRLFSYN